MNKFKDFLYETSDLLLGIAILFVMIITLGNQLFSWFEPEKIREQKNIVAQQKEESSPKKEETSSKEAIKETSKKIEDESITFTVSKGSSAYKVAKDLETAGIAKSKDFIYHLQTSGKENSVKVGTFKIKKGSSIESIVDTLTK